MRHGGRGGGIGLTASIVDESEEDILSLPGVRGSLASGSSSIGPLGCRNPYTSSSSTFKTLLADIEALHVQEMDRLRRKYEHMIAEMSATPDMGSRYSAPEFPVTPGSRMFSPTARPSVRSVAGGDVRRRTVVKSNTAGSLGCREPDQCPRNTEDQKPEMRPGPKLGDEDQPDTNPISRTLGTMHSRFGSKSSPNSPRRARPPDVMAEERDLNEEPTSTLTAFHSSGAPAEPSASTASGVQVTGTSSSHLAARRLPAWSAGATRGAEVIELNRAPAVKLSGNWDVVPAPSRRPAMESQENELEVEEDDECASPKSPGPARHGRFSDRDSMDASAVHAADPGLQAPRYGASPGLWRATTTPFARSIEEAEHNTDDPQARSMIRRSATRASKEVAIGQRNSGGGFWRSSVERRPEGRVASLNSSMSVTSFDQLDHFAWASVRPSPFVLSPVGYWRLGWDALTLMALSIDTWCTPFEIVFTAENTKFDAVRNINYMILAFFVFDIVLNFNTGFILKDRLVMQRPEIVRKYLQGYFTLDVIATIPWDFLNTSTGLFGMTRLVKVTKLVKVLRLLRLLRMRRMRQVSRFQPIVLENLRYPLKLFQLVAFIFFAVHLFACLYGQLDPRSQAQDDLDKALAVYSGCLEWAYTVFFVGSSKESLTLESGLGLRLLETCLVTVRVVLDQIVGAWLVIVVLDLLQESLKMSAVKNSVLKFFQQHKLSTQMQIQVMYTLHETKAAREMQRNFNYLMAQHVPIELRRAVSEELWTRQLLTLGLIMHIGNWHSEFVLELSMLVREEVVASKSVLCKAGSLSIAAYHILKGRLAVEHGIPDFTVGMWVGERALLSTNVRRTWTVIARTMSALMSVPSAGFAELLHKLGLEERYKQFIDERGNNGLCGRCGSLGDHFTHACPYAEYSNPETSRRRPIAVSFAQGVKSVFRRTPPADKANRKSPFSRRSSEVSTQHDGYGSQNPELYQVLHAHRLTSLAPVLKQLGVDKAQDICSLPADAFQEFIGDDAQLRARVAMLRLALGDNQDSELQENPYRRQHLMFLSHFKLEAGTEAALVRNEIENIFKEQPGTPAEFFDSPVFLDSEDLDDLEELVHRVENSHNILVLLTKGVFTRPWVLIEVVTARRANVKLIPVDVQKPSDRFEFPDELWYNKMENEEILSKEACQMLLDNDIKLSEVVDAIRELLKKIAVPYSPHRSASIRRAEVMAVLKQCRFKDMNQNLRGVLTRLGEPLDVEDCVGGMPSTRVRSSPYGGIK